VQLSKNLKICILQTSIYFGYEKSIFLLDKVLKEKTKNIKYVVFSNKVFENNYRIFKKNKIFKKFPSTFSGFRESFRKEPEFKERKVAWCYSWEDIKDQVKGSDIVIAGSNRNNEKLAKYCKINSIFLVIHKNPASLDPDTNVIPDLYILNNKDFLNRLKKFKYFSKKDFLKKIKVLGSLQYSYLLNCFDSESKYIFKKYRLNKSKKLIILYGEGPQFFNEQYINKIKEIYKIFKKSTFQLIYKPHPSEYSNRKVYFSKSSIEFIKKNIPICKDKDYPSVLKNTYAGLSFFGSISYELNIFKKPIIYVDRLKSYYELAKVTPKNKLYYNTKLSLHSFKQIVKNKSHKELKKTSWYPTCPSEMYKAFYGLDTDLKNLDKVLKNLSYLKSKKNKNVYNRIGQININLQKQMIDLIMKKYFETKKSTISKYMNFIYYNAIFFLKFLEKKFFKRNQG
jgi:hypothetical protein